MCPQKRLRVSQAPNMIIICKQDVIGDKKSIWSCLVNLSTNIGHLENYKF